MKKIIFICLIFLFLGGIAACQTQNNELTVGFIVPLTGPAAIWGEELRNGMELAKQDLKLEGHNLNIIYEDSKADPKTGLSAYHTLKNLHNVDIIISSFSSVSLPLIHLADQDQIPFFMTLVSAANVANKSPVAFRYFSQAEQYVQGHMNHVLVKNNYQNISILSINDEYGQSVAKKIKEYAKNNDIQIVNDELFKPFETDFRSNVIKIKSQDPDAILIVASVPPELINAVQQINDQEIDVDIFESSVLLSTEFMRNKLGNLSEGIYTNAFEFETTKKGLEFKVKYQKKYQKEPFFASTIGYDLINIIRRNYDSNITTNEFISTMKELGSIDSINGQIPITKEGEINPNLIPVQIKNNNLVII